MFSISHRSNLCNPGNYILFLIFFLSIHNAFDNVYSLMLSAYYTIVNNTILVFEMIIDHTRRVSEKKKTYKRYLKSHLSN